jgi:hypothetical protein
MFFDHKSSPGGPPPDLANLKITDARVGDTLSVLGAAPDFSDVDFTIDRRDQYEAGSRNWGELSGAWRDHRVYLEVHNEIAGVEVLGLFDDRRITLDEIGLSEDDLAQIDARQNPADFFDFEEKFWLYRLSREMGVFSADRLTSGRAAGRGFYCWVFAEQGGKRFLNIRKFEGEPFALTIWTKIDPGDITVYRGA